MSSITEIAKVAYEANRAYCESLGDFSPMAWDICPQWQRDTVMNGARVIKEGKVTGPEESHENWVIVKENEGWTHRDEKNSIMKTHPCMLPFNELPEEQQMKDHLFFAIVMTLLDQHTNKETLRERFDNFLSPAVRGLSTNEYNQLLDKLIQQ